MINDEAANAAGTVKINKSIAAAAEGDKAAKEKSNLEKARESKEAFAKTVRISHQCLMFYNIDSFSKYHQGEIADLDDDDGIVYKQIHLLSGDNAFAINNLNSCQNSVKLAQEIRNVDLSLLTPQIRLFKYFPLNGARELIEFDFPLDTDESSFFTNFGRRFSRGNLAGLKSFEYSYNGSDPFTATRDLEATLVMHFQSFDAIMEERPNGNGNAGTYRYLDLFTQSKCFEDQEKGEQKPTEKKKIFIGNRAYRPECFEIMVEVGYATPTENMMECFQSEELKKNKEAVQCFKTVLFLTVVDHQIDIREDGTIDVTVNYRARLEAMYRDTRYDLLFDAEFDKKLIKVEKRLKDKNLNDEQEKELKNTRDKLMRQRQRRAYNNIVGKLLDKGHVYFENIPKEEIDLYLNWVAEGFSESTRPPLLGEHFIKNVASARNKGGESLEGVFETERTLDEANEDVVEEAEETEKAINDIIASTSERLKFVFFGDLLNIALEIVDGNINELLKNDQEQIDRFHRTKFLLPSLYIETPLGDKYVNLAHIPISFDVLTTFMINKIVKPRREQFSLLDFVRSVVSELIVEVLADDCFLSTGRKKYRNGMSYFYAQPEGGQDPLSAGAGSGVSLLKGEQEFFEVKEFESNKAPAVAKGKIRYIRANALSKQVSSYKTVTKNSTPYEYICLYNQLLVHSKMRGNAKEDNKNNIIHFAFGLDRGLIKNAKFQKTDQPFLPEARYRQKGDHILGQLSNVYDVTFDMFGNNLFIPGQYIYYDPFTLSDELGKPHDVTRLANIMGLGGYHLITQITNRLEPGKFNTTVRARWVTSGAPLVPPLAYDEAFPESEPLFSEDYPESDPALFPESIP